MLVRDVTLLLCKASGLDSRSIPHPCYVAWPRWLNTHSLSLNRLAIAIAWVILIGLLRTALVKQEGLA